MTYSTVRCGKYLVPVQDVVERRNEKTKMSRDFLFHLLNWKIGRTEGQKMFCPSEKKEKEFGRRDWKYITTERPNGHFVNKLLCLVSDHASTVVLVGTAAVSCSVMSAGFESPQGQESYPQPSISPKSLLFATTHTTQVDQRIVFNKTLPAAKLTTLLHVFHDDAAIPTTGLGNRTNHCFVFPHDYPSRNN